MITKRDLHTCLKTDQGRYPKGLPTIKDWLIKNESWYLYQYVRQMRYVEYYQNRGFLYKFLFLWHFFLYKRLGFKIHIVIYPGTVGAGFRIYHVGGFTHVGKNVQIGKNCTMLPGVVFGNKTEDEDDRPVVVGDNCYFGLDAKILGPVRIGNNVTIGANSVVTKDVPDNAIVGGVPARIIKIKDNE